jgi:hypothetical protein
MARDQGSKYTLCVCDRLICLMPESALSLRILLRVNRAALIMGEVRQNFCLFERETFLDELVAEVGE